MKNAKLWIFILIVVAICLLNMRFGWSDMLFGSDSIAYLQHMTAGQPLVADAIYCLASVIGAVALALPGCIFAIAAGAVFDPYYGTLLCWVSMIIGAYLSFFIGRYFLKDSLKPKLAKSATLNKFLFDGVERSDVYLLAITRLIPVFPYNLQNFAYGITDIRFSPYALYSALFLLPGTAAYTVATAGVIDEQNRLLYLGIAGALFAASIVIARVLKKREAL